MYLRKGRKTTGKGKLSFIQVNTLSKTFRPGVKKTNIPEGRALEGEERGITPCGG